MSTLCWRNRGKAGSSLTASAPGHSSTAAGVTLWGRHTEGPLVPRILRLPSGRRMLPVAASASSVRCCREISRGSEQTLQSPHRPTQSLCKRWKLPQQQVHPAGHESLTKALTGNGREQLWPGTLHWPAPRHDSAVPTGDWAPGGPGQGPCSQSWGQPQVGVMTVSVAIWERQVSRKNWLRTPTSRHKPSALFFVFYGGFLK